MIPEVAVTTLAGTPERPLLVLGPSLGTSAATLWGRCAALLADRFHVLGWDLPGHGASPPPAAAFTIAELAAAVLARVPAPRFAYAGNSAGGAVGLHLLLHAPDRIDAAVLLCTGAKIGDGAAWRDRAATVRAEGTAALVDGAVARWFAAGSAEPAVVAALRATDREGYARVCEALGDFDLRERLAGITAPVLAVAGAEDRATPPDDLAAIARGVPNGRLVVLDGVAHLAPVERPDTVAGLIREHLERPGLSTRRAVLGDAHVDRSIAGTTGFTADFQDLITRYAWGEIWGRPGLDRRSRSLVTLTALVALGHAEELALHVRAARRNGLTAEEIKEVLLQTAIYCGVPAANTAFRVAQQVLAEIEEEHP